ncbi:hypothetical protein ABZ820_19030 [Streptomyces diacarni]|uniref:hypothetical protein n=1 Tax=Streptomyces diacarni TaxID=2800381 RepID=UPI00340A189D
MTAAPFPHLGPTLATATDPDHKGYLDWGPAFRRLGAKDLHLDGLGYEPKGYQVLGGILRYGNYDKRFLTPIAEHVVQLQQRIPRAGQPVRDLGAGEHSEAFLPGGKEVHENDYFKWTKKSGGSCTLSVDGEEELDIGTTWALRATLEARGYDTDHGSRLLGGRYYIGPRRANAYFPCRNPEVHLGTPAGKDGKPRTVPADIYLVEVESRHVPEDGAESKKAMKRFIVPFAEAVKEQAPCR